MCIRDSYQDLDGDGFGDVAQSIASCDSPQGYVTNSQDCDDNNPNINPDAAEACNDLDDNCNGLIDDGATTQTYYQDLDGDGFGDVAQSIVSCDSPQGYVTNSQDCDDNNPNINPDATEACNDLDDNCNGMIDESLSFLSYFED